MKTYRFGITLIAVASIATVVGVGVGATGGTPPWLDALNARSQALNDEHGLGVERRALGTPGPGWQEALHARSDARNRQYGLGDYAGSRQTTRSIEAPDWLAALQARSDALNRQYGLGQYVRHGARSAGAPDWLTALDARSDALNRQYGLGEYATKG